MKYLCLIYVDENKLAALPPIELEAFWSECAAYSLELASSGGLVCASLEPAAAAATLRRRKGKLCVTDGPFAETKEQLGGFILVDAANLDAAITIAAKVPAARLGSVEVRPVRNLR